MGRPRLPEGQKPSEGRPVVQFRADRELHNWLTERGGGEFARALLNGIRLSEESEELVQKLRSS